MNYRREIDGLRAVAVLPVILFHAGFPQFRGGYVGVDVFFVISGYLITSILLEERDRGTFTILGFYERRARRILPALCFVLLCCLPFAWMWMLPNAMTEFAQSLSAVAAFASNIFFWRRSGYFAPTEAWRPLQHTWSLAVEGQFYLVFPLFIALGWKHGKRWMVATLTVIAVASLAVAQWGALRRSTAAFYLLPTRGWELLAGALVAFYLLPRVGRAQKSALPAESAAVAGLLLIAFAVMTFDATTPFPGVYAIVPAGGTALVILFGSSRTLAGRLLGSRWLVGVGLVSYSAYLWHQPLFVFARLRSLGQPSNALLVLLVCASLVLAYGTWQFVERPFRNTHWLGRRTVFSLAAAMSAAFLMLGLLGAATNGFPGRLPGTVQRVLQVRSAHAQLRDDGGCNLDGLDFRLRTCLRGDQSAVPAVALWGDSYASTFAYDLGKSFAARHMSFTQDTKNGCPAVLNVMKMPNENCEQYTDAVFRTLQDTRISTVILASFWQFYVEGHGFDNAEGGVDYMQVVSGLAGQAMPAGESSRQRGLLLAYRNVVLQLLARGKEVILVYPVPEVGWDVPEYLAKVMLFGGSARTDVTTSHERFRQRTRRTTEAFDSIGQHARLVRIRPESLLCDTFKIGRCAASLNGVPLYYDSDHLSNAGAQLVVDEIMQHVAQQVR